MSNNHSFEKSYPVKQKIQVQKPLLVPSMNLEEESDRYIVTIALPGLKREDILVKVKGDHLKVSTLCRKKQEHHQGVCNHHEYDFTHGHRIIKLPNNADLIMIQAYYEFGELRLIVPKLPATALQIHHKPITVAIY